MKCLVCGFDGEFIEKEYVENLSTSTSSTGGIDVVTEIYKDIETFRICPNCKIMYAK
jgi:rubredoxin